MTTKTKAWCFTIFDANEETEEDMAGWQYTYLVYGREVCPDTNRPHLQGYVEFHNRKVLKTVKRIHKTAHWEPRRGSAHEASEYCKKDKVFVELGAISLGQGHRTDLEIIRSEIADGKSEIDIADCHFAIWVQHRRAFSEYRHLMQPPLYRPNLQIWSVSGPTGTGKTSMSMAMYPDAFIVSDPTLQWFDGYNGERVVIIDEYRGGARGDILLRLTDIYKFRVPVKGGFVPWNPLLIIFTSNLYCPWGHDDISEPIARRVQHNINLTEKRDFNDDAQSIRIAAKFPVCPFIRAEEVVEGTPVDIEIGTQDNTQEDLSWLLPDETPDMFHFE